MRRAAKTDANHSAVRDALRAVSMTVQDLSAVGQGVPDLLVGFRGINVLVEVKDGNKVPSARVLTADQEKWHSTWSGQVVVAESPQDAVLKVLEYAKEMGRI